ncbi:MAG TPA: hypothetical protein VJY33_26275, partial [Isosphaeraceae bacterium]|nr:hypothetical protein [Isosphaeraceae bacterium]
YQFITEKVLHKLNDPMLRLFGVSHVALSWMDIDTQWTSEKGCGTNNLARSTVPLLDRASPPPDAGGRMGEAGSRGGLGGVYRPSPMAGARGMMRAPTTAGSGMFAGTPSGAAAEAMKSIKTLTRTDFLIQFVWKPEAIEPLPDDPEQRKAKIKELVEKFKEAENQKSNAVVTIPSAEEIEKASKQQTSELEAAIQKALSTIANPAPEGTMGTGSTPAAGGGATPGVPATVPPP